MCRSDPYCWRWELASGTGEPPLEHPCQGRHQNRPKRSLRQVFVPEMIAFGLLPY
jgi:hypothetical protein